MFSHKSLQFKPPLEELRTAYYKEIKKFVALPTVFQGFGSSDNSTSNATAVNGKSSVFARMPPRYDHTSVFHYMYQDSAVHSCYNSHWHLDL